MDTLTTNVESVKGWLIVFAVTTAVSLIGNAWSAWRRWSQAKEREKIQKALSKKRDDHEVEIAKLKIDAEARKENESRWTGMYDRVIQQNADLMAANERLMRVNHAQSIQISGLMRELEDTKKKLDIATADLTATKDELARTRQAKEAEINELKRRLQALESEVKSLEASRDASLRQNLIQGRLQ